MSAVSVTSQQEGKIALCSHFDGAAALIRQSMWGCNDILIHLSLHVYQLQHMTDCSASWPCLLAKIDKVRVNRKSGVVNMIANSSLAGAAQGQDSKGWSFVQ